MRLVSVLVGIVCALNEASQVSARECVYPGTCTPPVRKFARVSPLIPRHQWIDDGGYCGSLSIQAIALTYGTWISQTIVRQSAVDGGGHGNPDEGYEILHTNIGGALETLGFEFETFQSDTIPQSPAYLEWLKKKLVEGYPVIWFVMCKGDSHDCYGLPNATYDHIEPVFGIFTDNLTTLLPNDVLVHGSDYAPDGAANLGYFRQFDTLVDTTAMDGNCSRAIPILGKNEMYPCLEYNYSYGVAITGAQGPSLPITLQVANITEPDVIEGASPASMKATVTVRDVQLGKPYVLYRFDNRLVPTNTADYAAVANKTLAFIPSNSTFVFEDAIISDAMVAYRATESSSG
ncbi:hypothetical protein CTAYLR_000948 [Chrysophaeum taylorii]|uniref:Peptidase C39-like domain-containing protein n=1 Tax=Chrysophaeum taylorii TaxID=2483200 RepID=A0AAD7XJF6_9STRA|nr:hypothetical protein CTAYLR_000948 [Chrysophaeum taylorii]